MEFEREKTSLQNQLYKKTFQKVRNEIILLSLPQPPFHLCFLSQNFFRDETFMLSVQFSFFLWEDILLAYFTLWKQSIILPCDQSKMKRKYKMISFTASRFKMKKTWQEKEKNFSEEQNCFIHAWIHLKLRFKLTKISRCTHKISEN